MKPKSESSWIVAFEGGAKWIDEFSWVPSKQTTSHWIRSTDPDGSSTTSSEESSLSDSSDNSDFNEHICYQFFDLDGLDEHLSRFTNIELESAIDGWSIRNLIDSFRNRWREIFNDYGGFRKAQLEKATKDILSRMKDLLMGIRAAQAFCRYEGEAERQMHQIRPNRRLYARISILWMYQELCMLRSELWMRYHFSYGSAYLVFESQEFPWQRCWFVNEISPQLDTRINRRLRRMVGAPHSISI